MIKATFVGNLGRDAELKSTASGIAVCSFAVAVSQRNDSTEWMDCALLGDRAHKIQPYLTKGKKIFVSGDLSARTFIKRSGEHGFCLSVRVDSIEMLSPKSEDQTSKHENARPIRDALQARDDFDDRDIPF